MDSPHSWEDEAQACIKDVEALVKSIKVSNVIESNKQKIYLNIVTIEDNSFCVELSSLGFHVVGKAHDVNNLDNNQYYDTPYSLLSEISESYTNTFANALIAKLQSLPKSS